MSLNPSHLAKIYWNPSMLITRNEYQQAFARINLIVNEWQNINMVYQILLKEQGTRYRL